MKIKLILMYIFGLGYIFYCGLYIWKYFFYDICLENSDLCRVYNILLILYIFILFIYFILYFERFDENIFGENVVLLGMFIINVCIWFDVIFFEFNFLFKYEIIVDNLLMVINVIMFVKRVMEVIEKFDLFLFLVMIEFFLIFVDMLFLRIVCLIKFLILIILNEFENVVNSNDFINLLRCV